MTTTRQKFATWTRGETFTLTMGRGQVRTLVAIDMAQTTFVGFSHPRLAHFIVSMRGLEERGLAKRGKGRGKPKGGLEGLGASLVLTEAGQLVISLLKFSGAYQSVRADLLAFAPGDYGDYYPRRVQR